MKYLPAAEGNCAAAPPSKEVAAAVAGAAAFPGVFCTKELRRFKLTSAFIGKLTKEETSLLLPLITVPPAERYK